MHRVSTTDGNLGEYADMIGALPEGQEKTNLLSEQAAIHKLLADPPELFSGAEVDDLLERFRRKITTCSMRPDSLKLLDGLDKIEFQPETKQLVETMISIIRLLPSQELNNYAFWLSDACWNDEYDPETRQKKLEKLKEALEKRKVPVDDLVSTALRQHVQMLCDFVGNQKAD